MKRQKCLPCVNQPTNNLTFFIRDLANNSVNQFTFFPHPAPQFNGVKKEQISYTRKDGVELTGTLYLPPNYDASQGRLPVLMWAYPQEFKDKKSSQPSHRLTV